MSLKGSDYVRPTRRSEIPIQMPEPDLNVLTNVVRQLKDAVERLQERVGQLEKGGYFPPKE